MSATMVPVGSRLRCQAGIAVGSRIARAPLRPSKAHFRSLISSRVSFGVNGRHATAHRLIVCSAGTSMENPFKYPRQMESLQSAMSQLPSAGVYVLGAALAVAFGGAGSLVAGNVAPESLRMVGRSIGGVIGAILGGFMTMKLKEIRQSAAIIELSNLLVDLGDPTALTREQVVAIEDKYGATLSSSSLEELKSIYGAFVEAAIPAGEKPLNGTEPAQIQNFKNALGLSDIDAAPVHMDVGRRILRGRLEAGSRADDYEARKTFQKLIYVSNIVFGERQAAFLLPWIRVFGLTEAQVQVARRDNARALFKSRLVSGGGLPVDRDALLSLKQFQAEVRVADDEAAGVIQEAAQLRLQEWMDRALECIRRRTRAPEYSDALMAVREAIDYNRGLAALKGDENVPAGVGQASLAGTAWDSADGRSKDVRDIFRVYIEERLSRDGAFTDALENDAADLRMILGLGPKEAAGIENDVKERAYRKLLREEFTSGRLEAASSKAEVLGDLVDRVRWDGDAAMELNRSLYRQKLSTLLEKKHLTDADADELARLQRMLCVPTEDRDAVHKELCGSLFRESVSLAMSGGIDGFGYDDRKAVAKSFEDLRLDRNIAKEIVDEVGRKYLLQFVSASRNQRDRIAAAKELKKMVFFSNVVIAPLVEDLKTEEDRKKEEEEAKQAAELQELLAKARADAEKQEAAEKEGKATKVEDDAEKEEETVSEDSKEDVAESASSAEAMEKDEEAAKEETMQEASASAESEETSAGAQAADEETKPKSLEKAQAAADARRAGEKLGEGGPVMKAQKEVNLAKDLDLRDRLDIYRNFLMYCMTGDVMQGPMGVQMVTERDESEFARLSQLGDVLGLTQMDVYQVHQGLAEQAFKAQVQNVMGDGLLTPERASSLEAVREKMGLPKEAADKIIKGMQNQKLISSMQAAKAQGNLTLDRIMELKDAGVDPSSVVSKDMLQQLYRQEISTRLSDGTGDFDAERLLESLPSELGLDESKAKKIVQELAGDRKRTTLVQAVSYLRQKKMTDAVKSLNNLRACTAALPQSEAEKWNEKEEVADLYSLYCAKEDDGDRRAGLQKALGLSDEEAAQLQEVVEAGQFKLGSEAEEEAEAFF